MRVTYTRMLKLRREAVIKEAVKFDVEPKDCWIKKKGKVCLAASVTRLWVAREWYLLKKGWLTMKAIVNTLGRHLLVMVLLSC